MTESQSILEREKSDYDLGRDRLSDLPLSIVHTILSSLPIKDAVRTSLLSKQWRYTWTGLPKLEFISNADEKIASKERLIEFISYALSVHKGPLQKFKLDGVLGDPSPNLNEWLIRVSTKDIRELSLMAKVTSYLSVHSSIYSCTKLTCLLLVRCVVGPPPSTLNGFSFLRNLTLLNAKISNATFESLVSKSPLLENLELSKFSRDEKDSKIRVHAPNLKYLNLTGHWTEMFLNSPLLVETVLALGYKELNGSSFCNYTKFLGGCTNLEKLSGYGQFTKVMSNGMESWNPNTLVFHRLTTISLEEVDFGDVKQQRVLARLLVGAPNLESLEITARYILETRDVHFSSFEFEPNFIMEKLRLVDMNYVRGLLPEIKLIESLLERSPLLERMSVGIEGEINDLEYKILGCTRASQNLICISQLNLISCCLIAHCSTS